MHYPYALVQPPVKALVYPSPHNVCSESSTLAHEVDLSIVSEQLGANILGKPQEYQV